MLRQRNVDFVCRFYERFARGDVRGLADLFGADFVFLPAGKECDLAGARAGLDELLQFAEEQRAITGGTWVPRPYDVLGSETHVAVLVTVNAARGTQAHAFHLVHVWRIEGGLARELRSYVDDQYAYDAFFAAD